MQAPVPIDEARLTSTHVVHRRRWLAASVRIFGAASFLSWMGNYLLLGDGGSAGLVLVSFVSATWTLVGLAILGGSKDRPSPVVRAVRLEGARAIPVGSSNESRGIALDEAVAEWELPGSGIALLMANGMVHEIDGASPATTKSLSERLHVPISRRALRMPIEPTGRWTAASHIVGFAILLFICGSFVMASLDHRHWTNWAVWLMFGVMVLGGLIAMRGIGRSFQRLEYGELIAGLDGVSIRTNGRTRFIPISEISAVDAVGSSILVHRHSPTGRLVEVVEIALVRTHESGASRTAATAVARAIQEAIDRRGATSAAIGHALDRGQKTHAAWRSDLSRAARVDPAYRGARMGSAELCAVVLDASAPPDRRVGAALALASTDRKEARALVRVTTPARADRDLRASLEAAAEGEIDERSLLRSMRLHGR